MSGVEDESASVGEPTAELAAALGSTDRERSDAAFHELRRRLAAEATREEAIDALLRALQSYIDERSVAAVFHHTRATFSAQDIAQSARWKVAVKLRSGKLDPLSLPQFKAYLRLVVDRFAVSFLRRRSRSGSDPFEAESFDEVVPAHDAPTASRVLAGSELFDALGRHLAADELVLVRLRVLGGASWEEVAAELFPDDSPERRLQRLEQLRMRLKRALDKLESKLRVFSPYLD